MSSSEVLKALSGVFKWLSIMSLRFSVSPRPEFKGVKVLINWQTCEQLSNDEAC